MSGPPEQPAQFVQERRQRTLQRWIDRVLTIGFWASLFCIVAGLVLALRPGERVGEEAERFDRVIQSVLALEPQGVVDLGIILLLLTPVLAVGASLTVFAWERDWRFVGVSGVLLAIVGLSIAVGVL